ncbi:hypothetical protein FRB91_001661 [Serendipita sp. 411]|nr:hypothetical protein FRB91_001661 [Serendipita sp. 411]
MSVQFIKKNKQHGRPVPTLHIFPVIFATDSEFDSQQAKLLAPPNEKYIHRGTSTMRAIVIDLNAGEVIPIVLFLSCMYRMRLFMLTEQVSFRSFDARAFSKINGPP